MNKKILKGAGVALLALTLTFQALPITNVSAAEYNTLDIQKDKILNGGDVIKNTGTEALIVVYKNNTQVEIAVNDSYTIPGDVSKEYVVDSSVDNMLTLSEKFKIKTDIVGQGIVELDGNITTAKAGETVMIIATAEKGWHYDKFEATNITFKELSPSQDVNSSMVYTFVMPENDISITTIFSEYPAISTFDVKLNYIPKIGDKIVSQPIFSEMTYNTSLSDRINIGILNENDEVISSFDNLVYEKGKAYKVSFSFKFAKKEFADNIMNGTLLINGEEYEKVRKDDSTITASVLYDFRDPVEPTPVEPTKESPKTSASANGMYAVSLIGLVALEASILYKKKKA